MQLLQFIVVYVAVEITPMSTKDVFGPIYCVVPCELREHQFIQHH
jgi:hypothetical protein